MATVTVIIVTYNSAHTIGHCIDSVLTAQKGDSEVDIVVVDNNSIDHTLQVLHQYYPQCDVIQNRYNYGFGYACNQGAQDSQSEYLLFLNPDIVIDNSAIPILLSHAQRAIDDQVLGGAPYDGRYQYLRESARKLPTILSALARLTGIDRFISSWSYYDGGLPLSEQQVDALTGAFLFISSGVFRSIAGFDEDFFLYGEDLDLFKRLKDMGIPVIQLTQVKAVHFKGESGYQSWNRNYHFYHALTVYAQKHFGLSRFMGVILSVISLFLALIKTLSQRFVKRLLYVILFICIYLAISALWSYSYFGSLVYLDWVIVSGVALSLAVTFVVVLSLFGYFMAERGNRSGVVSCSIAFVTVMLLYAFLPESLRFSRLSVVTGSLLCVIVSIVLSQSGGRKGRVFRSGRIAEFEAQIAEVFPSATFSADDYNSLAVTSSPFHIEYLEQYVNDNTQVYYYNERTKSLFNSDLSYRGGRSYEYFSKFNLTSLWAKRQRALLSKGTAVILSVLLLPLLVLSSSRAIIIRNICGLFEGEISLIGDYLSKGDVTDRPYIGSGILSIDLCDPSRNPQSLSYDYTLHYSILDDIYYGSSNFMTILKRIQHDIKD
jgi:GT2 family glycosyltransferase